jgi:hypothetical protein
MKYSILLLGHKNINQIKRVVSRLVSENCDIYLHLNNFFKVSETDKEDIINIKKGYVYLIPDNERVGIQYDGMGLTLAILKVAEAAYENRLNSKVKSSYFFFITAQDYPLKTNRYIENFLDKNYPTPLYDIHPWSKDNWVYHKFKAFYFHKPRTFIRSKLNEITYTNIGRIIRAPFEIPTRIFEKIFTLCKGSPYKILTDRGYSLFGGAPWWLFPDFVVEHLISNLKKSELYDVLRNTMTPDETLIHTFLMNSNYAYLFKVMPPDDPIRYTHTYEIFCDERRPVVTGHPHNLDYNDFEHLIRQPHLFARKFDINFDPKIYDLIDDFLNEKK